MTAYVSYLRVSTNRQGRSGLGLEAQRAAVSQYLGEAVQPVAEYREVESGRKADRPELRRALDHCRRSGAALVIAKLDRLSRNARFLLELIDSSVEVRFCDLPQVNGASGRFLLTSMAAVAELEAGLTSERTKAALQAARARGVKLGGPLGARPLVDYVREHGNGAAVAARAEAARERAGAFRAIVAPMVELGMADKAVARALNAAGEPTVSGKGQWTNTSVRRLRVRLDLS